MLTLIKINLIQKVRNHNFTLLIFINILLGYLCVPSISSGYSIFYLGGVRGIYNSAWLGSLSVLLPTILLWLPGFFILRNQITSDYYLKLNEIIAYSPINKTKYILSKCLSNFIILFILNFTFLISLMIMQLIRGEDTTIIFSNYFTPFVLITLPSILTLSSLTIIFDVLKFLRNAIGNILIFIIWLVLSILSIISPNNIVDLFCIGKILNEMLSGAKKFFPEIGTNTGSFGYYPVTESTPTFDWSGLDFNSQFIVSRLTWVFIFILLVIISITAFDDFKNKSYSSRNIHAHNNVIKFTSRINYSQVATVRSSKIPNLLATSKMECKLTFSSASTKLKILYVLGLALSWILPISSHNRWIPLIMLILLPILFCSSTQDRKHFTKELFIANNGFKYKYISIFITNIILSLVFVLGIIVRYFISGELAFAIYWLIGTLFTTVLALFLDIVTENEHFFEGIYIVLLYFGPINGIKEFDFLSSCNNYFYLILSIILLILTTLFYKVKFLRRP